MTLEELKIKVSLKIDGIKEKTSQVTNNIRKMNDESSKIDKVTTTKKAQNELNRLQKQYDRTTAKIEEMQNKLNRIDVKKDGIFQNTKEKFTLPGVDSKFTDMKIDSALSEDKTFIKLSDQADDLNSKIQRLKQTNNTTAQSIEKMKLKMDSLSKSEKISNLSSKIRAVGKNIGSFVGTAVKGLTKIVWNTLKWTSVLIGIGGVFSAITAGVNSYLEANEQLKANIDYLKFSIGQALAPVIEKVLNLMYNLLGIVGAIAKVFFGLNIFAGSYDKYMANASKNAKNTAKSAKETQNSIASFDEIGNIQKETKSDTSSSGTGITSPNINMEEYVNKWTDKVDAFKNKLEELKPVLLTIGGILATMFVVKGILDLISWVGRLKESLELLGISLGSLLKVFLGIGFIIAGVILVVKGLTDMINGDFMEGLGNYLIGVGLIATGILLIFGPIPALIALILGLIVGLVVAIVRYGEEMKAGINRIF